MNKILNIELTKIRPPAIILMSVDKDSLCYMELRDSIHSEGILQNLTVKESNATDYEYELVTGLKRYTIANELGLEIVPCIIVDAPEAEVIIKQIQENCCREQPSDLQLAMHFKRLLLIRPYLTYGDLAGLVNKSPLWVKNILSLEYLTPAAKRLVEDNVVPLTSAIVLSKLPGSIQKDLLESATELNSQEFLLKCRRIKKTYREAIEQGTLIEIEHTERGDPFPALRTVSVLRIEHRECIAGRSFLEDNPGIEPLKIWKEAIGWAIQLDPVSVEAYRVQSEKMEADRCTRLAGGYIKRKAKEFTEKLRIKLDSTTRKLAEEFIF